MTAPELAAPSGSDLSPVESALADLLRALASERSSAREAGRALEQAERELREKDDAEQAERELREKDDARRALRRYHSFQALGHVIMFLLDPRVEAFCPDVREMGLHGGLQDLLDALRNLEAGRDPDLLRTSGKVKGPSPTEAAFKGRAAAVVELLYRAGDPLPEAARRVAGGFAKAGFTVPRGGRDGAAPITAQTLLQWRKEARNAKRHPAVALVYERVLDNATQRALSREMLRKLAASLAAGLHADHDPTKNLRVK